MTRRFTRRPLLVAAALVAALACEPGDFPDRLLLDDFETLCEGVPCGWEQTEDTGEVRWVETIHPGEHALSMSGDSSARRTGIERSMVPMSTDTLFLRAAVQCDPGARLTVDVIVVDPAGVRRDASQNLSPLPQETWGRVETPLRFESLLSSPSIEAVILRKEGPGTCQIGELLIDGSSVDDVSCG